MEREHALLREAHRREARHSLLAYAQWIVPFYRIGPPHKRMAEVLERLEFGESQGAFIIAPPRHGKSLLCSVIYPAWHMGRHPTNEVIATSYGGELASGFGARLRNIMATPQHQAVFGEEATLALDARARDRWLTRSGGVYRAAGVGAGITGFGAHLLTLDDPVKSREEADSPTIQNRNIEWWRNDARSRLMKGGRILVVMTRWHERDLGGYLLDEMAQGGDQFEVLHMPAIDADGNALWADEYPVEALEKTRRAVGPRAWQALYQGSPTPDEGAYFKAEWLKGWTDTPNIQTLRMYGASDYAVTDGDGDYTVHIVVGVDPAANIYVLDLWREQATPDVWVEAMLDRMHKWQTLVWAEESGQIIKALGPYIDKRQGERKVWGAREQYPSVADKPTRARSIQARMAMGKVMWPTQAPWWPAVRDELLRFPAGKNDDAVDALSLVGRMLAGLEGGRELVQGDIPASAVIRWSGQGEPPPGQRAATYADLIRERKRLKRRGRR